MFVWCVTQVEDYAGILGILSRHGNAVAALQVLRELREVFEPPKGRPGK
jgi:hypothetical protein